MIVLVLVGVLMVILLGFAQVMGLIFGAILAFGKPRSKKLRAQSGPSYMTPPERDWGTELEGWDGEDELDI